MATLVLQAAGAAVGSLFGPVGTIVGRAIGGLAGYAIDQTVFGSGGGRAEGPRLGDVQLQGSREGTAIPRAYGKVRIAGQIVWATRFEEEVSEERRGGKIGGTTVRTYAYFANFAVGLCEGPIARVGRVWADGKLIDLSTATCRIYTGTETQAPDSLILAKQSGEGAPAYRGTAYVVFERLPLEDFGNRIPQLSFEVIRPVGGLEEKVRAVTIIPGATEFGYDPQPVRRQATRGRTRRVNRNAAGSASDWEASLDELQAVCPNLDSVGLVVAWFGNDLRAGECSVMPGVTDRDANETGAAWAAAGLTRATARLVSRHEDKPAYGGTPSDASVIRALRDLDERGLAVTFYPFIMMDVPAGNGLPDPYGGTAQAAYPWRGSITGAVAPGLPATTDKTAAAADEAAAFVGTASPDDFDWNEDGVTYSGPDEWSLRRLVLHNAYLCKAAGGVAAFLIGSELRGLTTLRSSATEFPFVAALVALAADVREVLGPETKISYAADWSEYFGHQPADGSGDVFFHLDPLWASDDIDFVGIDNYMPLADWRDGDHLDAAAYDSPRNLAYLTANIAGGEGFDWYYASLADRAAQTRTPITDGAYGKPWVFRYKDLVSWWGNPHHDRPGGVESGTPTAWVPEGKPIRFTELGCPAVDKGANQPNVFPDPKSSAGAIPYFSTGVRDDLAQRRFIEAVLDYWDPAAPGFVAARNPESGVYDGRMLDHVATHVWTWDARPYPMFPYRLDLWSDGGNWATGHWLTGRLGGGLTARGLVAQIAADYGVELEVGDLDGVIEGYLVPQVMSARRTLEPLGQILMFDAVESGETIRVLKRGRRATRNIGADDLAEDGGRPLVAIRRAQETELPSEIAIGFADALADYRDASVHSRRLVTGSQRTDATETNATLTHAVATGIADTLLQDLWAGREAVSFSLTCKALGLEAADICGLTLGDGTRTVMVTRVEDGAVRRIEARSIAPDILVPVPATGRVIPPDMPPEPTAPEILLLDLPLISGSEPGYAPRIAAFADPWPGAIAVAIGTAESGYLTRQVLARRATVGVLTAALPPGPLGRWDRANAIEVTLLGGALASEPRLAVLNGANLAAIGTAEGGYEVVQFETATLTGENEWRLEGLLRGQAGTIDVAEAGNAAGADFVLLNGAVLPLDISETESFLELTLRCGEAGAAYDPDLFTDVALTNARRGLMCLAPVHAALVRDPGTGDVTIGWIRQTRSGGDPWEPAEVPLGETAEAWRLDILDGATVVRSFDVATPSAAYGAAEQTEDFGAPQTSFAVRIRQVSPTEGPGLALETVLHA